VIIKNLALSNDETQRSSLESSLKPMTLYRPNYCSMRRFHTGVCSSRQITLIFDIFRIGVVTGYREGMLNLLNLFGLKRLPLLSKFHILLFCPVVSYPPVSCQSISINQSFIWEHRQQASCHVLSFGPSISRPAFSAPPLLRHFCCRIACIV